MIKYSGSNTITKMFQFFKSKLDSLAAVATTGSYNDLSDKPTIPNLVTYTVQITSDGVSSIGIPSAIDNTYSLAVYANGILLIPSTHYTIESTSIVLNGFTTKSGDLYTFIGTPLAASSINVSADEVVLKDTNNNFPNSSTVEAALVAVSNSLKNIQVPIESISLDGNSITPDTSHNVNITSKVKSVFNRTGEVTAATGDYTADQITETPNRVFLSPTQKTRIENAFVPSEGALPIVNGGTGAASAADARTNLGVPATANTMGEGSKFNYMAKNGGDANNYVVEGHYFVFNMSNTPSSYGFLDISSFNGSGFTPSSQGVVLQKFFVYNTGSMYVRTRLKGTTWSAWKSM